MRRFTPDPTRGRDLRDAFSRFGTGVTVVTTQTANGPMAMTANSFSSISLDPALVLWSPSKQSRRHDAFAQAAHFCIHVLGADQLPLALHFAETGDAFDQFEWSGSAHGVPVLAGCLTVFHCATHAIHSAGDHSLILGEVQAVDVTTEPRAGLIFERGRYGEIKDA